MPALPLCSKLPPISAPSRSPYRVTTTIRPADRAFRRALRPRAAFGLRVDLEFMRWRAIGILPQAEAIVRQAGKSERRHSRRRAAPPPLRRQAPPT